MIAGPPVSSSSSATRPAFAASVAQADTDTDDEAACCGKSTQSLPKLWLVLAPGASETGELAKDDQKSQPVVELYNGITIIARSRRGSGDNVKDDRAREFDRLDLSHEFGVDVFHGNVLRIAEVSSGSSLSRRHAAIWLCTGSSGSGTSSVQAFIIDMGSTNGTFVNGIKVRSHGVAGMKWAYQLREGDQVRFGQLSYILQNSQESCKELEARCAEDCTTRETNCTDDEQLGGRTSEKQAPPLVRELTSDHENTVSKNGLCECWAGESSDTREVICKSQDLSRNRAADSEGVENLELVIPETCSQSSPLKRPVPNQAPDDAKEEDNRKRARELEENAQHNTIDKWMKVSKVVRDLPVSSRSAAKTTRKQSLAKCEKQKKNICLGRSVARLNLVGKLSRLNGWKLVESVYGNNESEGTADILIENKLRRSEKILTAIALGVSIVSPRWVEASAHAKSFTPVESYILNSSKEDRRFQTKYGFDLWTSICKARHEKPLLHNYIVTFTRASYDKFENESKGFWDKVVAASGGKVRIFSGANGQKAPIAKVQRRRSPRTQALKNCDGDDCSESEEKTEILIALQSDIKRFRKVIQECCPAGQVYNPELLLSGILRQKLDFSQHRLL